MKSSVANEFSSLFLPRIVGKRGGPIGVFVRRRTRHGTTREDDAYHNKGVGETLLRVTQLLVNTERRREGEKVLGAGLFRSNNQEEVAGAPAS